jgi:predicted RecB family nuclease
MRTVSGRAASFALPVPHCRVGGYTSHCEAQRETDDHLSLVAWMRRDQVERLETAGIGTVAALAQIRSRLNLVHGRRRRLAEGATARLTSRTGGWSVNPTIAPFLVTAFLNADFPR